MISLMLFILGFILLLQGAVWLVMGASSIASRFGISELAIGLTVVSFGTSLPEMLVTQVSAYRGYTGLAIGNILGSNVANILLVLGVAAIIRPLPVKNSTVLSEIPFSLSAALLCGFLANAALFSDNSDLSISHIDGYIMVFFFLLFLLYVYKISKEESAEILTNPSQASLTRSWCLTGLGLVGLLLGGRWVVSSAIAFSYHLGISESLVGLTIVAIGTSLPELVASAVAAKRGKADMAVGNVVGSNIFNILWVLGFAAVIRELPFNEVSNTDLVVVILSSTILILALVVPTRGAIGRVEGVVFLLLYACYLAFLVQRG